MRNRPFLLGGVSMIILARLRTSTLLFFVSFLALISTCSRMATAQETLGNIVGRVRISRGDAPPERILVSLNLHQTPMDSTYTDSEGTFGFHGLHPESYEIIVNDEAYEPVQTTADIPPSSLSPIVFVDIRLVPKEKSRPSGADLKQSGTNPHLADAHDYSQSFPKKAVKEFEKGVASDHDNKPEDAITHYRKAIDIAPDYFPARNNLGALYLNKSDFKDAEEQFRASIRIDQNEAQAYFNLSNVLMLTNRLDESETVLSSGLQRRPDSAYGHFLQGCLYTRAGKLPEAEKSLQNALQLDAKMPQVYLQLVNLYVRENRRQDAIGELQTFLKAFPSAPAAPKAQQMLNQLQAADGTAKK
jgi:tetratricopeptide (TPR) repeat protein